MELSVYTMADLQKFRGLLQGFSRDGVETVADALALLTNMVTDQHQHIVQPAARTAATVELCPSCGKGGVTRWAGSSRQVGANVYGCKQCQWSEVRL